MLSGLELSGKTIVVTGGMGALGTAVVELLIGAGARCVVPGIIPAELERFALKSNPAVDVRFPIELTDEQVVGDLFGGIDRLWASIHIAGGFAMSPIAETSADALTSQLDMNVRTCFLCCREAVKAMRRAGNGGRIVNIAARASLRPELGSGMTSYAVSKAAVATLTQSLAAETLSDGILINAIAPSTLDTPANRAAMPTAKHDHWVALPAAANLIAYLVSPLNQAVSGAIVPIYARA